MLLIILNYAFRIFIKRMVSLLTEQQKFFMVELIYYKVATLLSLCVQYNKLPVNWQSTFFDVIIRYKGNILDALMRERKFTYDSQEIAQKHNELSEVRKILAATIMRGTDSDDPSTSQDTINTLEKERGRIEEELGRLNADFAEHIGIQKANINSLKAALPGDASVIEFLKTETCDFNLSTKESVWTNVYHYVAVILNHRKELQFINLGDASIIDFAITKFRLSIENHIKQQNRDISIELSSVDTDSGLVDHNKKLYSLLIDPILSAIENSSRLFISPDSELSILPLGALIGEDGNYLMEKYDITYVTSSRDILRFKHKASYGNIEIFADPDFDCVPSDTHLWNVEDTSEQNLSRDIDPGKFHFSRLKNTSEEGAAIAKLFREKNTFVRTYHRDKATESAFFSVRSPHVLHVATHGFFLQDQEVPKDSLGGSVMRDIGTVGTGAVFRPSPGSLKLENPLLRAGLAFAGANRWAKGEIKEGEEDGIVTAEEISGMELRGTDLVVLSACKTGLGEVRGGQGLMGLQRAFIQAGTKTLITSLWKVPDKETSELMVNFYRFYADGMPKDKALRRSQLMMIKALREKGREHPFYWAGFILTGALG